MIVWAKIVQKNINRKIELKEQRLMMNDLFGTEILADMMLFNYNLQYLVKETSVVWNIFRGMGKPGERGDGLSLYLRFIADASSIWSTAKL